ncbi:MAG: AI-2E family transporter [Bryobacteraceae bacterium]
MKPVTLRSERVSQRSFLTPLITITIVIAALYFGQEVLIPFALALLLSFLLTPPVTWLERARLGRVPSVLLVLVFAFSILGGILWVGTTQLADIVTKLPQYQENIRRKVDAMRNPAGFGMAKAADSIKQIRAQLSQNSAAVGNQESMARRSKGDKTRSQRTEPGAPVPVEVVKHPPDILESFGFVGNSLARFVGVTAAVLIFTLFMLLHRDDLRNRFFQLIGTGYLNVVTTALDDAARRVSRYLLTQSIINGTFGLLLGFGLYWIGVPNAPFWGLLGAILRFIPYVGTLIAGLCPVVLALAVFDGWARPMLALGLFATIELAISAAIEPWLYGAHTGISSLAILVSAAFWTLLWGPIGLVLSTPLTVCLLVLGRYVPQMRFLGVLLGEKAELPPEARFYQRLLAMDEDEAEQIAETYLNEKTLGELYDCVLIPALSLAEQDRHQNALDEEREEFIHRSTRELIEELAEETARPLKAEVDSAASQLSVVCIPARDEADELVGLMLAHVLGQSGYKVKAVSIGTVEDMFKVLEQHHTDVLFISALPPFAVSQSRSLCRRARRNFPDLKIVVGLWGSEANLEKTQQRLEPGSFDNVVTSLRWADLQMKVFAGLTQSPDAEAAAVTGNGRQ